VYFVRADLVGIFDLKTKEGQLAHQNVELEGLIPNGVESVILNGLRAHFLTVLCNSMH